MGRGGASTTEIVSSRSRQEAQLDRDQAFELFYNRCTSLFENLDYDLRSNKQEWSSAGKVFVGATAAWGIIGALAAFGPIPVAVGLIAAGGYALRSWQKKQERPLEEITKDRPLEEINQELPQEGAQEDSSKQVPEEENSYEPPTSDPFAYWQHYKNQIEGYVVPSIVKKYKEIAEANDFDTDDPAVMEAIEAEAILSLTETDDASAEAKSFIILNFYRQKIEELLNKRALDKLSVEDKAEISEQEEQEIRAEIEQELPQVSFAADFAVRNLALNSDGRFACTKCGTVPRPMRMRPSCSLCGAPFVMPPGAEAITVDQLDIPSEVLDHPMAKTIRGVKKAAAQSSQAENRQAVPASREKPEDRKAEDKKAEGNAFAKKREEAWDGNLDKYLKKQAEVRKEGQSVLVALLGSFPDAITKRGGKEQIEAVLDGEFPWEFIGQRKEHSLRSVKPGDRILLKGKSDVSSPLAGHIGGYADVGEVMVRDFPSDVSSPEFKSILDEVWSRMKDTMPDYYRYDDFASHVTAKVASGQTKWSFVRHDNVKRLPEAIPAGAGTVLSDMQGAPRNISHPKKAPSKIKQKGYEDLIRSMDENDFRLLEENDGVYPLKV